MKAWNVQDKNMCDGAVIIFAETRAKAIYYALEFTDEFEDCRWVDMRARRFPEYDQYYEGKSIVDFWGNEEHRIRLVRDFDWRCYEPDFYCNTCPAKKWCYWEQKSEF